jgi:hypothetical protein
MKLHVDDNFLTVGETSPAGRFHALGIHPSSEVDLAIVNGRQLSIGAIVPASPGLTVSAVRNQPGALNVAGDGFEQCGQRLVLQLYEDSDALVPPGPRAPVLRRTQILAANLSAVVATANMAFRLPFHGRRQATLRFRRTTNAQDLSVVVVGVNWGYRRDGQFTVGTFGGAMLVENTTETWFNGGAAPAVAVGDLAGTLEYRVVHIGGGGDSQESFDELGVFVFGAAGGGDVQIEGEAFGERVL